MKPLRSLSAAAVAAVLALPAVAQEPTPDAVVPASQTAEAAAASTPVDEPQFTAAELDELAAPIALYPDSLLAQIFVAATFPLDVIKAEQLITADPDQSVEARADAIEAEEWDESVQVLAAGFPTVIGRLADDIDWTEQLGNAVLLQTDDLLDAIQRLRAQAKAVGNLESNEAQDVEVEDGTIAISPADPNIVYVPSYDPAMAFAPTTAATVPVVANQGLTTSSLITTGAIAFGSALLIDSLFDDDDDWDDYWRGPPRIDWDEDDFRPRPDIDVDVDGDVNINRGRFNGGDRTNIDRAGIDRDGLDRDGIDRDALGGRDPERRKGSGGEWHPSDARRDAARESVAERRTDGGGKQGSLRASGGGDDARAKLSKSASARKPEARAERKETAFKAHGGSSPDVKKAKQRAKDHGPPKKKGAAARPKAASKEKHVSRPAKAKKPAAARSGGKKKTAFDKGHGKPKKAAARGRSSSGKHRR